MSTITGIIVGGGGGGGGGDLNKTRLEIEVDGQLDNIKAILLSKNKKYKDSVFKPINVFSKLDPREGILVRIDDKLKRFKNCGTVDSEDTVDDLIGYLVLLQIFDAREKAEEKDG
jgi:hypothetical protein